VSAAPEPLGAVKQTGRQGGVLAVWPMGARDASLREILRWAQDDTRRAQEHTGTPVGHHWSRGVRRSISSACPKTDLDTALDRCAGRD